MPPKRTLGTLGVLLCFLASGCGRQVVEVPLRPEYVVLTRVLRGLPGSLPEPHTRYPEGTRLERVGLLEGAEPAQILTPDLYAAGGAVPTLDGRELLFIAKAGASERYGVWACRPDGSALRRILRESRDCGGVAELPDGSLVYARAVEGHPADPRMRSAWALFVREPWAEEGRRITWGAACDVDPTVMADGRILYSSWQPDGGMHLWTVHPDGTGASRLASAGGGDAWALWPRECVGGDILFVRHTEDGAEVVRLDGRAPGAPESAWVLPVEESGAWPLTVEPDGRDGLLAPPAHGWEARSGPWEEGVDAEVAVVHAVRVASRPTPQGHLSIVNDNLGFGRVLALDARAEGRGQSVRITALDDGMRVLGLVPLAADGSFFVTVPADTRLVLDVLDAKGVVVGGQRTPFWVRPNEVRGCVGCHEDPQQAPPNRRPLAALEPPVSLLAEDER